MKKIFFIVMLLIGAITNIQAQEEEEETTYFTSFPVNYTGQKPVITDFVTAILSQSNGEGVFVEIADNWKKYQKGETLPKGKSFTVDTKNGYIRYDAIYSKEESVYVEFCFWNSTDGKHKIVASNFVLLLNGKPTDNRTNRTIILPIRQCDKKNDIHVCLRLGCSTRISQWSTM